MPSYPDVRLHIDGQSRLWPRCVVRAFVDAGIPAGVLGLVYGQPEAISAYLIPHPVIRKVTFTGSTPVGKQLAALVTGGERIGSAGNFFAPTLLDLVSRDCRVFNDEPFGPIAAVQGFDTLDDAINEANRLPYGLAAYAFTGSLRTAHALSQQLEVGMLWINQPAPAWPELPFGGVKDSGYGSEGGPEALEGYLNTKSVSTLVI